MAEFDPADFRDSIDDMCDDAVRRMFAIQEGGLIVMQPGDLYVSDDLNHNELLEVTEFNTRLRTIIVDGIHPNVVEGALPDYTLEILSGAVMALSKHAAHLARGSSVIVPSREAAKEHSFERMMMSSKELKEGQRVSLLAYELGSLGMTSLLLDRDENDWTLAYEANRRFALVR